MYSLYVKFFYYYYLNLKKKKKKKFKLLITCLKTHFGLHNTLMTLRRLR